MRTVAETIFFDSGVGPKLFGNFSLQIGDRDWRDTVGIEPPSLADETSGMICIRAGRLVALVGGILRTWNVPDDDALVLLGVSNRTSFETVVDRARMVLFANTYSVIAFSSPIDSSGTWFHRPNRRWNDATPLAVMLKDAKTVPDVFGYLESAVSPVTYLTEGSQ